MKNLFHYYLNKTYYFEDFLKDKKYIKIGDFYLLKELKTLDELKDILKNNQNLILFDNDKLKIFIKYKKNILQKILSENFKNKKNLFFYFSILDNTKISKNTVIDANTFEYIDFPKKDIPQEGIVFLKEKKQYNKNIVKEIFDLESFSKLIHSNQNIGLYVKKINQEIEITCYDYSLFDYFFSSNNEEYIFPILFHGKISNNSSYGISNLNFNPYNGAVIKVTIAKSNVSGSKILYPILASYNENNILIPDRSTISKSAKLVWDSFFKNNNIFSERFPIDDYSNEITKSIKTDNGVLFIGELNQNNSSEQKQIEQLNLARQQDPYNWAYKLNPSLLSIIEKVKNKLEENHKKNIQKDKKIIDKINNLSYDFFIKEVK